MSSPRVLVVGDVIDDIVVRPLGPIVHATDTPALITPSSGGSGANAAVWLARSGAQVRFVGRVAAVDVARHEQVLREAGIDPALSGDPDRPTGSIVVLVDADGERTMFTDRGANLGLTAADLPDSVLDRVDALHISGYSLFSDPVRTAVLDLAATARAAGVRVSVDPGSAGFLAAVGVERFLGWVRGVDALLPNLDEARLLVNEGGSVVAHGTAMVGARDDVGWLVEALLDVADVVAITCGPDGATAGARGSGVVSVASPDVEVVDTTGAGDAFTGAFLAAWLGGETVAEAVARGVAAGAEAVTQAGGRPRA